MDAFCDLWAYEGAPRDDALDGDHLADVPRADLAWGYEVISKAALEADVVECVGLLRLELSLDHVLQGLVEGGDELHRGEKHAFRVLLALVAQICDVDQQPVLSLVEHLPDQQLVLVESLVFIQKLLEETHAFLECLIFHKVLIFYYK